MAGLNDTHPEAEQVLREAYRVLAPGGRFADSDVVVLGHLPPAFYTYLTLPTSYAV